MPALRAPRRRKTTSGSAPRPQRPLRRHPAQHHPVTTRPATHPAAPHPDRHVITPTAPAPDIGGALPVGVGGTTPASHGGSFGVNPPATTGHWLAGVGKAITPGPAMQGTSQAFQSLGFYARRQMAHTWGRIGAIRSTIH